MNHRSDPSRGANKGNPSKKREGAMSPRASKRDTDDEADLTPEHDEYIASHAPLVDALTREIEIFVQRSQSPSSQDDVNDNCLLNLYIRFLPILHDNADGRWKELFSLDTLLRQNAIAPDQKRIQVLKTTNQELRTFTKSGGRLPDNAGLILIRGDLDAPDIPLDNFVAKINNAFWDDTFEGQNYDIYGPSTVIHSVQEHMERYFARKKAPEPIDPRTGSLPRNVLSLQGSLGDHVNLPWAVQTLRYNLLEILKERVQKKYRQRYESATGASLAGKQHSVPNWLFDVTACLRFCLFGDRGALSLNHLDVLNGTWVTCLSGCKLWFVYDGPWNDEVKAKFVNEGTTWVPQGQMKLIVLQPGDTLIMRPGYPIVHSVLTLEDSIMVGGMIWSQDNITNIIENLQYIMHKDRASVTNEHVPKQLPEYIESLLAMDSNDHLTGHNAGHVQLSIEEVEAVQALKDQLLPILSCRSVCTNGVCGARCPCKKEDQTSRAGCTTWCHDEEFDFRAPAQRCRHPGVPVARDDSCDCAPACGQQCPCRSKRQLCTADCHKGRVCVNTAGGRKRVRRE